MFSLNSLSNKVSGFMQDAPTTHESLKKDMESYLVTESSILEKVKKHVTNENINNGIGNDALQTLLTASLANKRTLVAQYLMEQGANLNMGTEQGGFPLVLAAKNGDFKLVQEMINRGATPANTPTLVGTAIVSGIDAKTLTLLLQKSAGFSAPDIFAVLNNHDLLTVLLKQISGTGMLKGFSKGLMMEKGCDLIPMMLEKKWYNVIRLFCDAGFELNHKDHIALIQSGRVDLVKYLLDTKAFFVSSGGNAAAQTPLMTAVQLAAKDAHIGYQMTELLLNYKADINAKNRTGIILVQIPNSEKKQEVVVGRTPLLEAVHQGNKNLVELLCTRHAQKEIREIPTEQGLTPLQVAVKNGNLDIIYTLVIWGADINVLTNTKENLLHGVTNFQIIQHLVGRGIDIFQPNGNTPREYPIVQMLLHEAQTKGLKEVYDDVLDPIFRQQITNINSFLVTLNANQKSKGNLVTAIVANQSIDMFKEFQNQKDNMRKMSLILAAMQKSPYSTHLATKSKEFQELVAEMEQTFVNLVTHPEFSAFITEMTSGRRDFSQCHEALKFIAGALTPVMAKYEKKGDATSKAMLAVEAQVNQAIMFMGKNKTLHDTTAGNQITSDLKGLSVNHETRNAGIALMTDPSFVTKFNQAVETKSEEELKAFEKQMKPFADFFQGQGDATAKAIHKMYVDMQAALDAIEYSRTGFLRAFYPVKITDTVSGNDNIQQQVMPTVINELVVVESKQEAAPVVDNEATRIHKKSLADFKERLEKKDKLLTLEGDMRAYLRKMTGILSLDSYQRQDIETLLQESKAAREPKPATVPVIEQEIFQPVTTTTSTSQAVTSKKSENVHEMYSGWVDEAIEQNEPSDLERHINAIQTAIENPKNGALIGKLQALKETASKALEQMKK